jgi:hypothetical protein
MAAVATSTWNLGFLTILQEPTGFVGGYLVTNSWGRPLEFRLSTAVQPNRVQQILYGQALLPYICGDLIGKTLVEKTAVQAQVIVTDNESVLELRRHIQIPVAHLRSAPGAGQGANHLQTHSLFPADADVVSGACEKLGNGFDFLEPFARIREAISEARKLGVTNRG